MNKKLALIDYYGMCDDIGNAMGHSSKVAQEYAALLKKDFEIDILASPCIIHAVNKEHFYKCVKLKYDIKAVKLKNFWKRIIDKFKLISNLNSVYRSINDYDIAWFYLTDFFGFLYVLLHKKPKKTKLICLIYHNSYLGTSVDILLNKIVQKAINKMDLIIYTQKDMDKAFKIDSYYMPDYYYDPGKYSKYLSAEKRDKAVCIGTMNSYKKLENLVEQFNSLGAELDIVGKFSEEDRAVKLKKAANKNILIDDKILSTEEYYQILAEAKYSVLPYDMLQYNNRTSGVLIESIFLNTIPVAPAKLLRQNEIPGLGYEDISELHNKDFWKIDKSLLEQMKKVVSDDYRMNDIKNGLLNKLQRL